MIKNINLTPTANILFKKSKGSHFPLKSMGKGKNIPYYYCYLSIKFCLGTSLVVQWIRLCLPMQGPWV